MQIEEINKDREKFLTLVNENVDAELNKIGLEVINVNIRDITDESGYIEAIGRKAAAQAINQAKIEVAEADKNGAVGEANFRREKEVQVATQVAKSNMGKKQAERDQRVAVAKFEAEGIAGEADSQREKEVAVAEQSAKAETGKKNAEREQRVAVASFEAQAVEGENKSRANIADYNAQLAERQATAKRIGETAMANAARDVLLAEKERELAQLRKSELAQQEVNKEKMEVQAEAVAEQKRRVARGEADAILAKYQAEAAGLQKVLEAKAKGYEELLKSVGGDRNLAPTLLLIEKLESIVAEQVKAIQNLKIDKITVWDGGSGAHGESGTTAGFLKSLIGSLPPMQELAKQAGVELPSFLGKIADTSAKSGDGKK
jgi:flotillin